MRFASSLWITLLVTVAGCAGGDDDSGRPVDAGPADAAPLPDQPDAGVCAAVEVLVRPVVPTVLLLVDRSGTMTDPFGEGDGAPSRWDALYATLMDPTDGLVPGLDDQVRFGLAAYTASDIDNDGVLEGPCPAMDLVPPALDSYDDIQGVYGGLAPLDETPTGPAVEAAVAALAAVDADEPRIIVLATDGEPDTCELPNPNGTSQARTAALLAVQAAFGAGVRTYVISVGGEAVGDAEAEAHMQELARAGVGLPADAEEGATLHVALDTAALVAAFDEIVTGVRSCTFMLDGEVADGYAETGTVTLDGAELAYGEDWRLLDGSTLELLGEACEAVLAGGEHEVRAVFTCEAIVE